MASSVWNPGQYERFRDERSQPFFDLLSMVLAAPGGNVVDLGCGTGELTRALHEHSGAATTVGLDNSETMLEKSRAFAGDGLVFATGDAATWSPGAPVDVLFSNAALQWLPDHDTLFTRLLGAVAPGGQVAIQMPANHDHPSHVVAAEVAGAEPFRSALGGYRRESPVREPEWYAELLDRLGLADQHVRLQVYLHRLAARDEVVEWVRGTLLTDYRSRMPEELFEEFLAAYRRCLLPRLEDSRPYRYPFKRLLFWGRRPYWRWQEGQKVVPRPPRKTLRRGVWQRGQGRPAWP